LVRIPLRCRSARPIARQGRREYAVCEIETVKFQFVPGIALRMWHYAGGCRSG